ncbi:hypothetical protein Tco_0110914 [Tanacetum coccineum]
MFYDRILSGYELTKNVISDLTVSTSKNVSLRRCRHSTNSLRKLSVTTALLEAAVNQYLKPADKQTEMILEMQLKEEVKTMKDKARDPSDPGH